VIGASGSKRRGRRPQVFGGIVDFDERNRNAVLAYATHHQHSPVRKQCRSVIRAGDACRPHLARRIRAEPFDAPEKRGNWLVIEGHSGATDEENIPTGQRCGGVAEAREEQRGTPLPTIAIGVPRLAGRQCDRLGHRANPDATRQHYAPIGSEGGGVETTLPTERAWPGGFPIAPFGRPHLRLQSAAVRKNPAVRQSGDGMTVAGDGFRPGNADIRGVCRSAEEKESRERGTSQGDSD